MAEFRPVYLPNTSQACHCSACVGVMAANENILGECDGREGGEGGEGEKMEEK